MLRISRIASSRLALIVSISARDLPPFRGGRARAAEPQRRKRHELRRAVVQIGADAPQVALVKRDRAFRGALDAHP